MIREVIQIIEQNQHKLFIQSAMKGCGVDYEFKKNDEEKGFLDTNYIYINHGKYKLVISISLPNKKEGIMTYSTSIYFEPEDKRSPKIYFNAINIDDAISWVEKEAGILLEKKKLKY